MEIVSLMYVLCLCIGIGSSNLPKIARLCFNDSSMACKADTLQCSDSKTLVISNITAFGVNGTDNFTTCSSWHQNNIEPISTVDISEQIFAACFLRSCCTLADLNTITAIHKRWYADLTYACFDEDADFVPLCSWVSRDMTNGTDLIYKQQTGPHYCGCDVIGGAGMIGAFIPNGPPKPLCTNATLVAGNETLSCSNGDIFLRSLGSNVSQVTLTVGRAQHGPVVIWIRISGPSIVTCTSSTRPPGMSSSTTLQPATRTTAKVTATKSSATPPDTIRPSVATTGATPMTSSTTSPPALQTSVTITKRTQSFTTGTSDARKKTAVVAGSSVGAMVGVVIVLIIIVYCYRRRNSDKSNHTTRNTNCQDTEMDRGAQACVNNAYEYMAEEVGSPEMNRATKQDGTCADTESNTRVEYASVIKSPEKKVKPDDNFFDRVTNEDAVTIKPLGVGGYSYANVNLKTKKPKQDITQVRHMDNYSHVDFTKPHQRSTGQVPEANDQYSRIGRYSKDWTSYDTTSTWVTSTDNDDYNHLPAIRVAGLKGKVQTGHIPMSKNDYSRIGEHIRDEYSKNDQHRETGTTGNYSHVDLTGKKAINGNKHLTENEYSHMPGVTLKQRGNQNTGPDEEYSRLDHKTKPLQGISFARNDYAHVSNPGPDNKQWGVEDNNERGDL